MPDLEITVRNVLVEWGELRLSGPAQLRLTSDAVEVDTPASGEWKARYADLRGAGWRAGAIILHGEPGSATIESAQGLDQAWASLIERACPLPELTRAHRALGSRRGGAVNQQATFFAPLLQARRRLEEIADLDTRVAALDAKTLRERMLSAIQGIANDAHPASAPDRRALEAELEEVMLSLFAAVDQVQSAAQAFRTAPEAVRFSAWRDWVVTVAKIFVLADNGWVQAARLLPTQSRR